LKLRLSTVLLVALAAFAIEAGAAFALPSSFVAPLDGATISGDTSFIVDTTGVSGVVAGVDIYTNTTGDLSTTQYDGGWSNSNVPDHAQSVALGGGRYRVDLGTGGWGNVPSLTFVAVVVDATGAHLDAINETLTIDNDLQALNITSIAPAADSTVSGAFTLTAHATDQNEITTAEYSIDGGYTYLPLASEGAGVYSASVDTSGMPNGDLYVLVRFQDQPGNTAGNNADELHLVVQNAVAPAIVPNTLVAEKSQWRTDETQLEVGDTVTAYNMQADGFPVPVIHYLWNICRGQVCTGVTPGTDGDYIVQPADVGATLTLIATATNASGSDFTSVDFGVIAPAFEPAPEPTPPPVAPVVVAPVVVPAVIVPPVVVPPVVVPPVVVGPVVVLLATPAELKAVAVAKTTVTAKITALAAAEKAKNAADASVKTAQKSLKVAVSVIAAPTATPSEKKTFVSAVQTLVAVKTTASDKVAAATAAAEKAAVAKNLAAAAVKAAQKSVAAAETTTAKLRSQKALLEAKAIASAKAVAATTATKKVAVVEVAAVKSVATADKKVATAVQVVSAGTVTPSEKKQLDATVATLVKAKSVAAAKATAAKTAAKELTVAKQTLTVKKSATKTP
jgi:hypothetical protein